MYAVRFPFPVIFKASTAFERAGIFLLGVEKTTKSAVVSVVKGERDA